MWVSVFENEEIGDLSSSWSHSYEIILYVKINYVLQTVRFPIFQSIDRPFGVIE